MMKAERKGGRKERKVESRNEEDAGEEKWRHGEARRTRRVSIPKGNQVTKLLSINNLVFFLTSLCFIEVERTVVMSDVTLHRFFPRGLNG